MNRTSVIVLAGVGAIAAVPGVAGATMAYVTTPRSINVTQKVMVANDDGSGARVIAPGVSAVISPDGARVAYQASSRSAGYDLETVIADVATGAKVLLGTDCITGLTWSPDSRWLACQTQSANRAGIVTGNGLGLVAVPVSLDGVTTLPVSTYIAPRGNAVDPGVAFSPDSSRIAFSLARFPASPLAGALYVAPVANAAARTRVLTRGAGPAWGTAGIAASRLTSVRVRLPGSRSLVRMVRTQVWVVQPDGTGARQVTRYRARGLTGGPSVALWSPGADRLVGTVGGEDQQDMATIAVASGAVRVLRRGTLNAPAAISADGQRILYSTGVEGGPASIRVIGVNGTGNRVLVRNAGQPSVSTGWTG